MTLPLPQHRAWKMPRRVHEAAETGVLVAAHLEIRLQHAVPIGGFFFMPKTAGSSYLSKPMFAFFFVNFKKEIDIF
jgi:hypothetical protein